MNHWSALLTMWPVLLGALAIGYLLGSIPFGLLLTKLTGGPDIRSIGSGNIGATNVLRTGRKGLAAATLIADMLKGTAAVLLTRHLFGEGAAVAGGLGAFLGHLFPIWLGFRGGKGVATFIGVLLGFSWIAVVIYGAIWIGIAALTRYSSLAGLTACAVTTAALGWLQMPEVGLLFSLMTLLIYIKHRANIARLFAGTETRIGQSTVKP